MQITSSGFILLVKDGVTISQHREVKEAVERASQAPGNYVIRFPDWGVSVPITGSTRASYVSLKARIRATMSGIRKVLTQAVADDFQLAAGHWIPAKMPPIIIHPRPNSETQSWDYHRKCPAGINRDIPIVVQGGAYPFHFEILSGPSFASIGADRWDNNYGILRLTNPDISGSPYTITIRAVDQDGNSDTATWTLAVVSPESASDFMFVDISATNNNGTGAYSSPKKNHAGWYGASKGDATNIGKQVIFRTGDYPLSDIGVYGDSGVSVGMTTIKPTVFLPYPGESVTWDYGNAYVMKWESNANGGGACCGITHTNPRFPAGGPGLFRKSFLWFTSSDFGKRYLVFGNTFDGGGDTSSDGGSNSAAVMFGRGSAAQPYTAVSHNTFYRCDNMDLVLYYDCSYLVAEENEVTGSYGGTYNPSWGFFLKGSGFDGGISYATIRRNRMLASAGATRPLYHMSEFTNSAGESHTKDHIEVCWNSGVAMQNGVGGAEGTVALGQGGGGGSIYGYGIHWCYRNSWRIHHLQPTGLGPFPSGTAAGPFIFENEVIDHDAAYNSEQGIHPVGSATAIITRTNVASGQGLLDTTTNFLTGSAATTYLGTHGAEIA